MRTSIALAIAGGMGLAAAAHAMKPGLWEVTTRMSGAGMPEMPAIPEAERKQMEAMGIKLPAMAGGAMTLASKLCVTREQAEQRLPPQSEEDRRQRCEQTEVKTAGSTVTWKIRCSGEQKMSGSGSITYQGEERYQGEASFNLQDAAHGPATMKQSYSGKWLAAACK